MGMILAITMLNVGVSKASTIPGQSNSLASNSFSRIQAEQEMILFNVTSFDTRDFLFDLGEVNQRIHSVGNKDTSENKNEENLIVSEVLNKSTGIDDDDIISNSVNQSDKNLIVSEVLNKSTGKSDKNL